MKVCIEKDQQGSFFVSVEQEQPAETNEAMPGETPAQESAEQSDKQPAADLKEALMLAGRMLSSGEQGQGQNLFDSGMASSMPKRAPVPVTNVGGM
jgi:hypothetical protein